ncbi:MAG: hypothetical protein SNH35_06650 [Rikenellaceae bacterium]
MEKYNIFMVIEPEEVKLLAFTDVVSVPDEFVGGENIRYALSRFVQPVVGERMLCAVSDGNYEDLKTKYLQPAIAFYVRHISGIDSDEESKRVITRARHYLKEMSRHLNTHSDSYREYDGAENILNRCKIHGDLVQIL